MTKKQTNVLLIIVLVLLFVGGFLIGFFIDKHRDTINNGSQDIIEMIKDINNADPNDVFLEIQRLNEILDDKLIINQDTAKIGFSFSYSSDNLVVTEVLNKDLAASLYPGDVITHINDNILSSLGYHEILSLIQDATSYTLKVITKNLETKNITAALYNPLNLLSKQLNENTAWIKLNNLSSDALNEFTITLTNLEKDVLRNEDDLLILDLRDASSGNYQAMASFIKQLLVVKQSESSIIRLIPSTPLRGSNTDILLHGGLIQKEYQIKVLINENTSNYPLALATVLARDYQIIGRLGDVSRYLYESIHLDNHHFSIEYKAFEYTYFNNLSPLEKKLVVSFVDKDLSSIRGIMFEENLIFDSVSSELAKMQVVLNVLFDIELRTDGYYDEGTKDAINRFQSDNQIVGKDYVCYQTYQKLVACLYSLKEESLLKDQMIIRAYNES